MAVTFADAQVDAVLNAIVREKTKVIEASRVLGIPIETSLCALVSKTIRDMEQAPERVLMPNWMKS